jgi:hypothetical protein
MDERLRSSDSCYFDEAVREPLSRENHWDTRDTKENHYDTKEIGVGIGVGPGRNTYIK